MIATQAKTRADVYKEANERRQLRKVVRITTGRYTYEKAVREAEARGFDVILDEPAWNAQAPLPANRRKLGVVGRYPIILNNIMDGNTRSDLPSPEEKAASLAKSSRTHKDRDLGQKNWQEASATKAAMRMLDPNGIIETAPLPDGLNGDFQMRLKDSKSPLYAGVQVKSGTGGRGMQVNLHVRKADGGAGGRYEAHILLAVVYTIADRAAAREEMNTFDAVPDVEVLEILLYESAADMPGPCLRPSPRGEKNDKYGDSRYVVGFDDITRLELMRERFCSMVQRKATWTSEGLWFAMGSGTPNPRVSTKHATEMLNLHALAKFVGFESLRAPQRQNETVDVIWTLAGEDIRISLKTASTHDDGFRFNLGKHPHHEHCDLVLAFYKDGNENRTHLSVISPARVYAEREVQVEQESFKWSKTNNGDVLVDTINLSNFDALDDLIQLVQEFMP